MTTFKRLADVPGVSYERTSADMNEAEVPADIILTAKDYLWMYPNEAQDLNGVLLRLYEALELPGGSRKSR